MELVRVKAGYFEARETIANSAARHRARGHPATLVPDDRADLDAGVRLGGFADLSVLEPLGKRRAGAVGIGFLAVAPS